MSANDHAFGAPPWRIDVHHHIVPPFWADALPAHGGDPAGWGTPSWSMDSDLAAMDKFGIRKAMLSLTSPGVGGWKGAKQADMARKVNEYAAEVVASLPGRYGSFATLPMGDVDAALNELAFAFDTLRAAGVVLLSNIDGIYLGDARFDPIWAELDRRQAVVFIHPTVPMLEPIPGIPAPLIDFPFDTTRAAVSMLTSGVMTRHRKMKVILSHAGGFLPFVAFRVSGAIAAMQRERSAPSVITEMKQFYFDTALSAGASTLRCLLDFAADGHVLYGSDIPYANDAGVAWFTRNLDQFEGMDSAQRDAINTRSAQALLQE